MKFTSPKASKSSVSSGAETVDASPVGRQKKSGSPAEPKAKQASKGGAKSFTLLVGDEGAILVLMQGATLVRRLFAASAQAEHVAPLTELLRAHPGAALSVLVDVIDQQYVRHTFPPVSQMSIAGLVKRRMERDFNPEDMKAFLSLGRADSGRKEWQYLIISLTNTPLMQQWLEWVVEQPNPLSGVYLLPVEMQQSLPVLSKALGQTADTDWRILITHNKVSGFRIVVLNAGKLVFTRVLQAVEDVVPAVIAGTIEQEIISTIEYIRRLNYKEGDALALAVIAAKEVVDALDLKRFNAAVTLGASPFDVADALGLKQAALSADRFGDVVLAALFSSQRKRTLRFSNRYIDQMAGIYKARLALRLGGALIMLALLGMAGMEGMDMLASRAALADLEQKKQAIKVDLTGLQRSIDGLDSAVAYKSLVVAAYAAYAKDRPSPDRFADDLTPFLTSAIRVRHMDWNAASPVKGSNAAGGAAAAAPKPITVDFSLTAATTEPEALSKLADKFVATLKEKMKGYDITVQPYSWATQKQASQEIALDAAASAISSKSTAPVVTAENKFTVVFAAAKAGSAPPPSASPPPAAMPGGAP